MIKIPTAKKELVEYLSTAHNQLQETEQSVSTSQLALYVQQFSEPYLLAHKDKHVRILLAVNIADLLRIYAPDAPFEDDQLDDICTHFVHQLALIWTDQTSYHHLYYYLLDSLYTIQSCSLICQSSQADLLLESLFSDVYKNITKELQNNHREIYHTLAQMLVQLINDSTHVPEKVITLLMRGFEYPENSAQYVLSGDLCKSSTVKLQRYVCQYFGDLLVSTNELEPDSDEDSVSESKPVTKSADKALVSAHTLLLKVNESAPDVVLNVIPQIEQQLGAEDTNIRSLAVDTVGIMISKHFIDSWPSVWKTWCGRGIDKTASIRVEWTEHCIRFLKTMPHLNHVVVPLLDSKLGDMDEKVRIAAIEGVGELDLVSLDQLPVEFIQNIALRMKDKKAIVRGSTIKTMGKIFNCAFSLLSRGDNVSANEKFGWIPSTLFELMYLDLPDVQVSVDKALYSYIFPPDVDDEKRTDRMLLVLDSVFGNEKCRKAFLSILETHSKARANFAIFLEYSQKYNGGIMDSEEEQTKEILEKVITHFTRKMPEQKKAHASLWKFVETNDKRSYNLLKSMSDPNTDYKQAFKHYREMLKKFTEAGIFDTFSIIQCRIAFLLINKNMMPCLTARLSCDETEFSRRMANTAKLLISDIGNVFPAVYRAHISVFIKMLAIFNAMCALANFLSQFPNESIAIEGESLISIVNYALTGTHMQAKNAAILSIHLPFDDTSSEILEKIVAVMDVNNPHAIAHLSTLSEFATHAPVLFDVHQAAILKFVVHKILMKDRGDDASLANSNPDDWVEFEDLDPFGQCRVLGLRLLVNRLLAGSNSGEVVGVVDHLATSVIKLLHKVFCSDGELVEMENTSVIIQTHLRYEAALSVLKLVKYERYRKLIGPQDFERMALIVQDVTFKVRNGFTMKLVECLLTQSVPSYYIVILFLAAHEPDPQLKSKIKVYVSKAAKGARAAGWLLEKLVEYNLCRLLHLLAHHPDYSNDINDLNQSTLYIEFFLDCVATADNVSSLYFLSAKLKTMRDLFSDDCEGLYTLCDLAQFLIKERCDQHSWSLPTYPGQIGFPRELFTKVSSEEAGANLRRVFLDSEFIETRKATKVKKIGTKNRRRSSGVVKSNKRSSILESDDDSDDEKPIVVKRKPSRKSVPRRSKTTDGDDDNERGIVMELHGNTDGDDDNYDLMDHQTSSPQVAQLKSTSSKRSATTADKSMEIMEFQESSPEPESKRLLAPVKKAKKSTGLKQKTLSSYLEKENGGEVGQMKQPKKKIVY